VRKGKGVVHLTVQVEADKPVETLCERKFEAADYTVTDLEATCAACLRRREDPSRLSNALFGQDLGSKLLELSLSRARKRPEDQQADDRAAKAEPPRLRVVAAERGTERRKGLSQKEPVAPGGPPEAPALPQPAGLDLSHFEKLGRDQYRSPAGVVIRIVVREGTGWDVADVDYDGEVRLEQLADGRVRIKIGDLRIEYTGKFERRLRLT
jgi:hypothetical protein